MRCGLGFAVLPGGGSQYPAMPLTGGATFAGTPSNFFSFETPRHPTEHTLVPA
jgi:hypothetical protein